MKTDQIIVVDYDFKWAENFIKIQEELHAALGDAALSIEHVGSTSVVGLAAKPIIDIDVVIPAASDLNESIKRLNSIGYMHEGNLGIQDRDAFKYEEKNHLQKHHLYVCPAYSKELYRHITFRDYLRNHPDAIAVYSQVKKEGAELYLDDMEQYII